MLVQKGGILYTFESKKEPEELKFIFSNFNNRKDEFELKKKLVKCYINHKKLGVTYSKEIMDKFYS
jgi:hypothetical protein